jgi:hypothetical protein
MLVEVEGCVFDATQLPLSHGHSDLDPVAKEAFVNHIHLEGPDCASRADAIVLAWCQELRDGWPKARFRIYREVGRGEATVRFHMVRQGVANWAEACDRIVAVGPAGGSPV